MKKIVISATGHRPKKLDRCYDLMHPMSIKIGRALRQAILEIAGFDPTSNTFAYDNVHLISGMALGVDTIFAKVGLKLRQQFPQVFSIEAAVPCRNHASEWPPESQRIHAEILGVVNRNTLVTDAPYRPALMQIRNEYMVNHSDVVIAVWDGTTGGTGNCVNYAIEKGVQIYRYHPWTNEVTYTH